MDGVLRGVADLRILGPTYRREGEAAFSVEKDWQRHGVGSALFERIILAARNRGIKNLHVCCPIENLGMRNLAKRFDAELTPKLNAVIGKVENPLPTPLSVMRELVVDSHSFAAACVDYQSRLFKV